MNKKLINAMKPPKITKLTDIFANDKNYKEYNEEN